VIIDGFKNEETAQTFMDWYCEQGEQDICTWLDCRIVEGMDVPEYLNSYKTEKSEIEDNTFIMYIKQE
jgi:hypothetical protein